MTQDVPSAYHARPIPESMLVLVFEVGKPCRVESRRIDHWAAPRQSHWLSTPMLGVSLPFPVMGPNEDIHWIFSSPVPRIYKY